MSIGALRPGFDALPPSADDGAATTTSASSAAAPAALTSGLYAESPDLARVIAGEAKGPRFGDRGEAARLVQQGLERLGLLSGAADGVYGRGTQAAVAAFQRQHGLTADGIAGPATIAKLDSVLASGATRPPTLGERIAKAGQEHLNKATQGHLDAIERTGIGTYYGDHSSFKSLSTNDRQRWLAENAKPGEAAPTPKESSCIGWAMENVKAAYDAVGKGARWAEIQRTVVAKGSKGTDLAIELQKDGWQAVYFNPDAKNPEDGNREHSYTAAIVKRGQPYYGIKVDAVVTDYRPTPGGPTQLDTSGYDKLKEVPFFFGLARGGVHTFVGQEGRVNEFHWTAQPNDTNAIEERALPDFPWNSGVIMVPPGTWPK